MTKVERFVDCDRTYYRHTKARYAAVVPLPAGIIEEVMFGYTHHEGGTPGEMAMRWHIMSDGAVPRLECFDDGWAALATFSDVIAALAPYDDKNITPDEFCALLDSLGFGDKTMVDQEEEPVVAESLLVVALRQSLANRSPAKPHELVGEYEAVLGRLLTQEECDALEEAWNSTGRRPWQELMNSEIQA